MPDIWIQHSTVAAEKSQTCRLFGHIPVVSPLELIKACACVLLWAAQCSSGGKVRRFRAPKSGYQHCLEVSHALLWCRVTLCRRLNIPKRTLSALTWTLLPCSCFGMLVCNMSLPVYRTSGISFLPVKWRTRKKRLKGSLQLISVLTGLWPWGPVVSPGEWE